MYSILVVDDEKNEREGIKSLIQRYQYDLKVYEASNGEEAFELLKKVPIDILFTDIKMPFMTGIELIETVYRHGLSPVCIIYSAYDEFEYAQNAIRLDVVQYLLKPVKLEEFQSLFQKVLQICRKKELRKKEKELIHQTKKLNEEKKIGRQLLQYLDMENEKYIDRLEMFFKENVYTPILLSGYSSSLSALWEDDEKDVKNILGDKSIIINNNDGQFLLITGKEDLNEEQISLICEELIDLIRKKYKSEVFIIAGNKCSSLKALKKEYKQICEFVDYQFFMSGSMYFLYGEQGVIRKSSVMLPLYFERILTFAKLGDIQGMRSEFAKAFEYIENSEGFSSIYIKYNFSEVIKKCCAIFQCEEKLLSAVEEIFEFNSINQLKEGVFRIIDTLFLPEKKGGEGNRIVMLTKNIINESYSDCNLSVSSIAEELNISASYLSTIFKMETDQNLIKYISQYRIEKAKELLKISNLKVKDIAIKVGYPNASYFISLFKNIVGTSPEKYREKNF